MLLASCGGGGGGGTSTGTVSVLLTDSPACGYDHVYVTVDDIEMSSNGTDWTSVPVDSTVSQPIDLLNLTNGTLVSLGQAPLAAGTYQQVRLVLKANGNQAPWANYLVQSGSTTQLPLTTPSGQQSGYKIVGPFTVPAGAVADLILDFNACKSVVVAGNSGKFNLKPVVRAVAQVVSGSITGTTTAGSDVYAEQYDSTTNQVTVVTGAVADATTGAFTLSPIVASGTAGDVDVVVVPPSTAKMGTAIIQKVPVTAGAATSLGTIALQPTTINTATGTVTVAGSPGDANLVVNQTISVSGTKYQIASKPELGGSYSFSLAATGPWIGTYSTLSTTGLTKDIDPADVGKYKITATDTAGTSGSQPADVSAGAATVGEISLNP
jgi:hypothetical protein